MYNQTITLFNYVLSKDDYFRTVISNVEVQPIYSTHPNIYQTDDTSTVLVIIPYSRDDLGEYVITSSGAKKYYKKPKAWRENADYFTIQNDLDFLIVGDFSSLTNVNINNVKNEIDDVFMINKVRDFPYDIKHFEITCN